MLPSVATIPNTLTNPNPGNQTIVPVAAISVSFTARQPSQSLFTNLFDFSRVSHFHPKERISLRFSRLLYHPSKATQAGENPRSLAVRIMAWKWSFLEI